MKNVLINDQKIDDDSLIDGVKPNLVVYFISNFYFFTKKDLEMYCKNNSISVDKAYIVEYYKSFACRNDVLRIGGKYYAAVDEDGYSVYNYERSINNDEYAWEFVYGSLRDEYQMLKDIGIVLEDDVYGKIDEENEYMKKMIRR